MLHLKSVSGEMSGLEQCAVEGTYENLLLPVIWLFDSLQRSMWVERILDSSSCGNYSSCKDTSSASSDVLSLWGHVVISPSQGPWGITPRWQRHASVSIIPSSEPKAPWMWQELRRRLSESTSPDGKHHPRSAAALLLWNVSFTVS